MRSNRRKRQIVVKGTSMRAFFDDQLVEIRTGGDWVKARVMLSSETGNNLALQILEPPPLPLANYEAFVHPERGSMVILLDRHGDVWVNVATNQAFEVRSAIGPESEIGTPPVRKKTRRTGS
jgi:hypothetical protein